MALTDDEKKYLDEKFESLQRQMSALFRGMESVNDLKVEVAKRPTIFQLLAACATTFTIAIAIVALFLN